VKPANILVQPAPDGSMHLRVADFGIGGIAARPGGGSTRGKSAAPMERTSLRGSHTPLYASPQQARGEAPATQDDVHALGVVWYQFLTGQLDAPAPSGYSGPRKLDHE
jgi:serine/threonine protein kinase